MRLYHISDWSGNPVELFDLSLRATIVECESLTDADIQEVAGLEVGQTFERSEFSITCTREV